MTINTNNRISLSIFIIQYENKLVYIVGYDNFFQEIVFLKKFSSSDINFLFLDEYKNIEDFSEKQNKKFIKKLYESFHLNYYFFINNLLI